MKKSLLGKPTYKDEDMTVTLILVNNVQKNIKTFSQETLNRISKNFHELNEKEKSIVVYIFQE
jgi:DNA-directed RNA polymerase specialized sigma subunit